MTRSRRVAYLLSLIGWLACVTGAEAGRVDPVRARALWNAMPADGRRDLDWGHQLTHKPSTELRGVFVTQLEGGGSTTAFPHMRIRGKKVSGTWQLETVRARRDGLPWQRFETLPDLVEGRGTPPYLLTAVAHQRALGVEWGTLGRLVTDIQSPGVAMDFEVLRRGFVAQHGRSPTSFAEQAALVRQTHFVQSIESMLALSGHAVTGATLTGYNNRIRLGELIDWFTTDPQGWQLRAFAPAWNEQAHLVWPGQSSHGVTVDYSFKLALDLAPSP